MIPEFWHSLGAVAATLLTLFVAWLLRRDNEARAEAARDAHRADLQRRIEVLETNSVTHNDLRALSARLDEIRGDLREIRASIDNRNKWGS